MSRTFPSRIFGVLVVPLLLMAVLAQLAAPSLGSWHTLTAHQHTERDLCELPHDRNYSHAKSEQHEHEGAHACVLCRSLSQISAKWTAPTSTPIPSSKSTSNLIVTASAFPVSVFWLASASPRAPPHA